MTTTETNPVSFSAPPGAASPPFQCLLPARRNGSSTEQWVFVALPNDVYRQMPRHGWARDTEGKRWPFVSVAQPSCGVRILTVLDAATRLVDLLTDYDADHGVWAPHPIIGRSLGQYLPVLRLGGQDWVADDVNVVHHDASALQVEVTYHHEATRLTATLHAEIPSTLPHIEWTLQVVYGTTANDGQPQVAQGLPALSMVVGGSLAMMLLDSKGQNRIEPPFPEGDRWVVPVWRAGARLHRGSRCTLRGCMAAVESHVRQSSGRAFGLFLGWDGNWGPFGVVPRGVLQPVQQQSPSGSDRLRVQEPFSGTTGEQRDFGYASDLAVSRQDPSELTDALWQCEGYALRPTCLVEPGGRQFRPELHPRAELYNQRPDLAFGADDRVGWPPPNQILYIPGAMTLEHTTSDNEHRSDLFLHATARLTGEWWLYRMVQEHVLLDRCDLHVQRNQSQAARAIGRLSVTRAWQAWLGFAEAADRGAQYLLAVMAKAGTWNRPDGQHIAPTLEQAKYGWLTSSQPQSPVMGCTGWGASLVALGAEALARVSDGERQLALRGLATRLARHVTNTYWRMVPDATMPMGYRLLHAYAIADAGGVPVTAADWPTPAPGAEGWTDGVFVSSAADYWTASCAMMLTPETDLERAVHARWARAGSSAEARWLAVQ